MSSFIVEDKSISAIINFLGEYALHNTGRRSALLLS